MSVNGMIEKVIKSAVEIADTEKLSLPQWRELRRIGLGGSDSPGVLGVSPWSSPLTVWMDKTGRSPEKKETHRMTLGRIVEIGVLQMLPELVEGAVATPYKKMLQSKIEPLFIADIDGLVIIGDEIGVLEIKSILNDREWKEGPPKHVYVQGQHYLYVTGLPFVLFVAVGQWDTFVYRVERDEDMIRTIVREGLVFWEGFVVTDIAPSPTGIDAEDEYISSVIGTEDSEAVLPEDLVSSYLEAKRIASEADKKAKELYNKIKVDLGASSRGVAGKYRIIVKKSERAGYTVAPSVVTTIKILGDEV